MSLKSSFVTRARLQSGRRERKMCAGLSHCCFNQPQNDLPREFRDSRNRLPFLCSLMAILRAVRLVTNRVRPVQSDEWTRTQHSKGAHRSRGIALQRQPLRNRRLCRNSWRPQAGGRAHSADSRALGQNSLNGDRTGIPPSPKQRAHNRAKRAGRPGYCT
jgi:hypothetical protein